MTGYRIKNPRAVIDRKKVLGQVDDLFRDAAATPEKVRPELLALLKTTLETGRNEVRGRLDQGATGAATVHANSYLIDQMLRVMYDTTVARIFPLTNPTTSERLSLVAVGGYGRSELAPHSDIDLLFLLPYKQTPWGEQVVEYLLYLLWDLGLKVGYATRSVDACIGYARDDMTIRTG